MFNIIFALLSNQENTLRFKVHKMSLNEYRWVFYFILDFNCLKLL